MNKTRLLGNLSSQTFTECWEKDRGALFFFFPRHLHKYWQKGLLHQGRHIPYPIFLRLVAIQFKNKQKTKIKVKF